MEIRLWQTTVARTAQRSRAKAETVIAVVFREKFIWSENVLVSQYCEGSKANGSWNRPN